MDWSPNGERMSAGSIAQRDAREAALVRRPERDLVPGAIDRVAAEPTPVGLAGQLLHAPLLRRALVLVLLAVAWEAYGRFVGNDLLFPTLTQTLRAWFAAIASGELPGRVAASLQVLGLGYAAGLALAAIITTLAVSSRFGSDLLAMLSGMLNPLPAIALLPLALLWFGIGTGSLVFVLIHSVLWAVAVNAQSGFESVNPVLRMVGQNVGLKGWRHVVLILAPAALPAILAGLKIGWAFAWRTLIAAELVFGASAQSGGLGWFISENRNSLRVDAVFAGLLTVILIGLVVETVVFRLIERWTVRRWGMQRT
jgi:NitT/TauT family transport system permease protein